MSDPREPVRITSNVLYDLILKPHTIISPIFSFKKQECKSCPHWRGGELDSYFWREEHKRICENNLNHKINLLTIPLLGIYSNEESICHTKRFIGTILEVVFKIGKK